MDLFSFKVNHTNLTLGIASNCKVIFEKTKSVAGAKLFVFLVNLKRHQHLRLTLKNLF